MLVRSEECGNLKTLLLQLWQYGLQYMAELVLEGFARAGVKGRCTMMGRSAMSVDLQVLAILASPLKQPGTGQSTLSDKQQTQDCGLNSFCLEE